MEYYAAVTMLKQMVERELIDEEDYRCIEEICAKQYCPRYRYKEPGIIAVEAVKGA